MPPHQREASRYCSVRWRLAATCWAFFLGFLRIGTRVVSACMRASERAARESQEIRRRFCAELRFASADYLLVLRAVLRCAVLAWFGFWFVCGAMGSEVGCARARGVR